MSTEKSTFTTLCGFPFDHSTKSDCHVVCQKDNPEDFKACEDHFKTTPVKPEKKAVTGGKDKSKWGHLNGSQAGLIDDCLVGAKKPLPLSEIAKFADGKPSRVLHHLKHLVKNKGAGIDLTKENLIFWSDQKNMKKVKSIGSVMTLTVKKGNK